MSCEACDNAVECNTTYPYRWKNTIIVIQGCRDHVKGIMEALSAAQAIIQGTGDETERPLGDNPGS